MRRSLGAHTGGASGCPGGRISAISDGNYYSDNGATGSVVGKFMAEAPEVYDEAFPSGVTDGYALEQLDWLQSIAEGRQPRMCGAEGTIDLALACAILEPGVIGREVTLDEILNGEVDAYQKPNNEHYGL